MNLNISAAHNNYSSRPADERFETITALKEAVGNRAANSVERKLKISDLRAAVANDNNVVLEADGEELTPTHWGFGQVAKAGGAPAPYLRTLSTELAVSCLNYGLDRSVREEPDARLKTLVLDRGGMGTNSLRALTSTTYGRIWDKDVVQAVENLNEETGNRFDNPPEWGGKKGGLYASDRDVFIFMIDGGSIVDGGGERDQLHRGFFASNSEVGNSGLNIMTFLFRWCCGNYMIGGAEELNALNIIHTHKGPQHFVQLAMPFLLEFMNSSTKPMEAAIKRAKCIILPDEEKEYISNFRNRGFGVRELTEAKRLALEEEGQFVNLWDSIQGLTAYARSLPNVDTRVDLQKRAGSLLKLAAI